MSAENFTYDYTLETRSVEAPVEQGQVLGTITAYFNGRSYGTLDLVATCSVERDPWLYRLDGFRSSLTICWCASFWWSSW